MIRRVSVSKQPHERKGYIVGMFDRDKEFGLDVTDAFQLEVPFILWGAEILPGTITTEFGEARKVRLVVQRITTDDGGHHKPDGTRFDVTSLHSAIADKVAEAEAGDFPCYVDIREVQSKRYGRTALVLQWLGDANDDLSEIGGGRMNHATGEIAPDAPSPDETDAAPSGRRGRQTA